MQISKFTSHYIYSAKPSVYLILSFILIVATFPFVTGDYFYGLDGSYFWAHNYFFDVGKFYNEASLIYGPLAFLRHPFAVGNNMIYGILFLTLIKYLIAYFTFLVNSKYKNWNFIIVFVALYLLFTISPAIDYLALVLILLLILLHNKSNKHIYLFCVVLIVIEGFYIKNSIGISAAALCAYYFVFVLLLKDKKYKLIIILLVFLIVILVFQGLVLFGSFQGILNMFQSYFYSTIGFSENMPVDYGPNSTLLLIVMAVGYILQVVLIRDEVFRLYWLSSFFAIFSVFKHSMVRCDGGHYYSILMLYLQFLLIVLLVVKKINIKTFVLVAMPLVCYYLNLNNKWRFEGYRLQFTNGFSNLYDFTVDYKKLNANWIDLSEENANNPSLILSEKTLSEIGNHTVDFYPWELSYAWKNKINWKPRSTLQSLSMHEYFDEKTAGYFSGNDAPDFLIWHLNKRMYGFPSDFTTTDARNLFTDDPLTTTAILKSYTPIKIENANWILKRKKRNVLIPKKEFEFSSVADLRYWVDVPQKNNYLTVASIKIKEKLYRKLKRFAFKDEIYWIEFITENGSYYKNRVSTSFLKNNIWIGIYIRDYEEKIVYDKVSKFKITAEKDGSLNFSKIGIKWSFLEINPSNSCDTCETANIQALFMEK